MQNNKLGAKRRKGFGEYGPQCPTGAVAKRLGVNKKRTQCEATQGVWGIRSPMPLWGCHVVTGGE